jgi:hypothetical protein
MPKSSANNAATAPHPQLMGTIIAVEANASGSFPGFEGKGFYVAEEKRDSVAVVYIPRGLKGKKV